MSRSGAKPTARQNDLFRDLPASRRPEPKIKVPAHPIWTQNKALLIERYLYYFVLVTRHGTYVDGFAGPQNPKKPSMWSAKLVVESQPRWLRHIFLFEQDSEKVAMLNRLREQQPERDIRVFEGDCNKRIPEILASGAIGERQATFCLLDQRTFECDWATVATLAAHKKVGHKIELFYFLANHWLNRALAAVRKHGAERVRAWWGSDDWKELRELNSWSKAEVVCKRFRQELGYASAKAWPVYNDRHGRRIMYFMVHAADHPEAPRLMARAYASAVRPKETPEQLGFALGMEAPKVD